MYAAEDRQKALAAFLLGVEGKKITIATVSPDLDVLCMCMTFG